MVTSQWKEKQVIFSLEKKRERGISLFHLSAECHVSTFTLLHTASVYRLALYLCIRVSRLLFVCLFVYLFAYSSIESSVSVCVCFK